MSRILSEGDPPRPRGWGWLILFAWLALATYLGVSTK
jgi:hypothetical protein